MFRGILGFRDTNAKFPQKMHKCRRYIKYGNHWSHEEERRRKIWLLCPQLTVRTNLKLVTSYQVHCKYNYINGSLTEKGNSTEKCDFNGKIADRDTITNQESCEIPREHDDTDAKIPIIMSPYSRLLSESSSLPSAGKKRKMMTAIFHRGLWWLEALMLLTHSLSSDKKFV